MSIASNAIGHHLPVIGAAVLKADRCKVSESALCHYADRGQRNEDTARAEPIGPASEAGPVPACLAGHAGSAARRPASRSAVGDFEACVADTRHVARGILYPSEPRGLARRREDARCRQIRTLTELRDSVHEPSLERPLEEADDVVREFGRALGHTLAHGGCEIRDGAFPID